MDLRTKLVFALIAVTLGTMLAFGGFMGMAATRIIDQATIEQLEGLADSNADALESIVEGWRDRVRLVASRTQLRISLDEYNRTADPAAVAQIRRILGDATRSARTVVALAVYAADGSLVAATGVAADSLFSRLRSDYGTGSADEMRFLRVSFTPDGRARVAYAAALSLAREQVGSLFVVLSGARMESLTSDTTGLGKSGEILIVMEDTAGARTLHPVRFQPENTQGSIVLPGASDPSKLALEAREDVYREGLIDYRGQAVWAATRYNVDTRWGVVVKFDAAEKGAVVRGFREQMFSLAVALAGIGIIVARALGFKFGTPIHDLSEVTNRIREGDLDARAEVKREDDIGNLARNFNNMADELEKRLTELHEFKKFFDVSLDMMCIAGTDGYFKRVNPAFGRVLGWSDEQLLSRPFYDLVHPDDFKATMHEIEKLSQGIPTISFVNRFECADGSWKNLRWNSYPEPETKLLYAIARETSAPEAP